nr:hypothetical protein [Actinomycetales bacterium]
MTESPNFRRDDEDIRSADPVGDAADPTVDGLPEEGDPAVVVAPNQHGIAAVVPGTSPDYDEADGPATDTAGNPLTPEERDASGDHKPFD